MIEQTYVDGNALAGMFHDIFGSEMTGRPGCCGHCGAVNALGAVRVYRSGPGDVVRCPACDSVLMVLVQLGDRVRIGFGVLSWIEHG